MAVKQTAGRDALGEFAPKFAELNDEVLFGQVWSREDKLSLRDRSLVTVVALMAQGLTDSSFRYHLTAAKNNGITRTEIAEILTQAAFYVGWPKAWAAFRMAKEVWAEDAAEDAKAKHQSEMVFPIGASNDGFAPYFSGKSYLAPLSTAQVGIYNVTFEPGCRNIDLVGRCPANYLMGRERTLHRIAPLTPWACTPVVLCGISTCFQVLSPCEGQLVHALLTRPPLKTVPCKHFPVLRSTCMC